MFLLGLLLLVLSLVGPDKLLLFDYLLVALPYLLCVQLKLGLLLSDILLQGLYFLVEVVVVSFGVFYLC